MLFPCKIKHAKLHPDVILMNFSLSAAPCNPVRHEFPKTCHAFLLLSLFAVTILGKKVRFNISVISLTVPVISYRLGLSSLLFSRKKVPSVCSERTIHFRYATVSIAVLFLRS